MRSKFKMTGIVLAAFLAFAGLSSCTAAPVTPEPTNTEAPVSAVVSCGTVGVDITAANAELATITASLAGAQDEPTTADAEVKIDATNTKLEELNAKAEECKSEGNATNLVQCRTDAILAYMKGKGFKDGDYVIGEENIDKSAPALTESGSLAFGKDGKNVETRDDLQEVFDSSEPILKAVVKAQQDKFPSLNADTLFDTQRWEVVQTKVPSQIEGNTGYSSNQLVDMGTRDNKEGDASWLFIDTSTCTVPVAEQNSPAATAATGAGEAPPVGLIRVGCINPGDNLVPNYPPPPTPVVPVVPPEECPPGNDIPGCAPKLETDDVTPVQGADPQPATPETYQPDPPAAPETPLDPGTPVTADPGPAAPVEGATPAPPAPPAPVIPEAPAPSSPGTPITDPDG